MFIKNNFILFKKNKAFFALTLFLLLVSLFLPKNSLAAACPFVDGGYGDDDSTANGTIYINHTETLNISSVNQGIFDCSTLTIHLGSSGKFDITRDSAVYQPLDISFNNLTLDTGSIIEADGQGYAGGTVEGEDGEGPAGGTSDIVTMHAGAGGGHGGKGGDGNYVDADTELYGSVYAPLDLGSGGGAGEWNGAKAGKNGGGAIKLTVIGSLVLNGELSADGESSGDYGRIGAGAGGSIWVDSQGSFSGSGTISVNGGTSGYGSGGGGRVFIEYDDSSEYGFTGTVTANGTTEGNGSEEGTVVYRDNETSSLHIKNTQRWIPTDTNSFETWFPDIETFYLDSGTLYLDSLNVGQTAGGRGWDIEVATMQIDAGAVLSADGMGYLGGTTAGADGKGPAGGASDIVSRHSGAGGGHNSMGGDGSYSASTNTYDSLTAPLDLGSGGGAGEWYGAKAGKRGGGAIKLTTTESLVLNGEISADGISSGDLGRIGAGAGGSIWLSLHGSFSGSGTVTATGGSSSNGGSGAGGLILLTYKAPVYSGTYSVLGGTGDNSGENGTISTYFLPEIIPDSFIQYTNDGNNTQISTGSTLNFDSIKLRMKVKDYDNTSTLAAYVEVVEIGSSFTNIATSSTSSISWTGSPSDGLETFVTVSNLSDITNYKWQAKVCDADNFCSLWTDYGDNNSESDFYVLLNQTPNSPTDFGPERITTLQKTNDTDPSFQFNLTDPDDDEQIKFQIQIDNNSDFSSPTIDYTSAFGDEGVKAFTVGQTLASGTYTVGGVGQTLSEDTYYWRVKNIDDGNGASVFTSPTNTSFVLDITGPTNASTLQMKKNIALDSLVTAEDGKKWTNNPAPYFSWTAGTDTNTGIKGYCLYLGTDVDGNPRTSKGLLGSSDPTLRTYNNCQFITTDTSIDFANLSIRGDTWLTDSTSPYYFKVIALDNADNTFNGPDDTNIFTFYYDATSPTNTAAISTPGTTFSNIDDMYFSWFASDDPNGASDTSSGLLGYQYKIGSNGTWTGDTAETTVGINLIDVGSSQPFYFSTERDGDDMTVGDNIIYFKTVDQSGNFSSYVTNSITYGGDAPNFSEEAELTVTPDTNTENNYALSWDVATPAENRTIDTYYYMVNTTPPATRSILEDNSSTYIETSTTSVATGELPNLHKGSNTVYVVVVDDLGNYSPSNYISANFTLDSDFPDAPKNLVLSDASLKSASLWRSSLAWEQPDYVGTGSLLFTIQRSLDGSTWSTISTTSGYAYVDTVSESKEYYWRVGSSDNGDESIANPTYSSGYNLTPKGAYTEAASLTSDPVVSSITTKRATITWTTNRSADSKIAFGTSTEDYLDEEPSNSSQVTDHTINLINLAPGTTYYYKAKWTDEDGNTGESDEQTFTTTAAPTVKDVEAKYISISSAILEFTTKGASTAKIYYGTSTSFGGFKELTTSPLETTYNTELTGLQDGSKYYYQINTFDSEGDEYEGTILSFETLPRPRLTNIQIQQVDNSAQPTLVITWQSNTQVSSIVSFYPESTPDLLRDDVDVELTKGDHQAVLRGLLPNTKYLLVIKGRDKVGNETESDSVSFTTATDTRSPKITNLQIEGTRLSGYKNDEVTSVQLVISWDTDEPATSQVEYGEGTGVDYSQLSQEDGSLSYNHVVVIAGLSPAKVYHLRAISKDIQGNQGHSIDRVKITPNLNENVLGLVIGNLQEVFGFLNNLKY